MSEKKRCLKCLKDKNPKTQFYLSYNSWHGDGRLPYCKECLKGSLDEDNYRSILKILRMIDRPYRPDSWNKAVENEKDTLGIYLKDLALNYKYETYDDSIFDKELTKSAKEKETPSKISETSHEELEDLKEKYGYGYPDNEYLLFESKFQQLKPSFQLPTTMHEEYLREYCVNKVKETLAKARGDFKEAKDWASMAKDVADAGKLKPSQMSKADLSQGLDGFGQLAKMVEEKQEVMPVLPKFTARPKDKVDVVLWHYVNYVRDLKGLPEAEYSEIYEFYEKRKEDYEKQELDGDPSMQESDANG